jgi:hypothetical protein
VPTDLLLFAGATTTLSELVGGVLACGQRRVGQRFAMDNANQRLLMQEDFNSMSKFVEFNVQMCSSFNNNYFF